MNVDNFINGIGNSLFHWTSYISDVNRIQILNEGSIKYGISEYLEVSKASTRNNRVLTANVYKVAEYEFEHVHEIYKSRRTDLWTKLVDSKSTSFLNFEFKFARSGNLSKSETDRYINDVFRLFALTKKFSESNRQYFVLLGPREQNPINMWVNENFKFAQFVDTSTAICRKKQSETPIKSIFSFDINNPKKTFKADSLVISDSNFGTHLERFNSEYTIRDEMASCALAKNDIITTKLVYSNKTLTTDITPMAVFIWEIMKDQSNEPNVDFSSFAPSPIQYV